MNNITIANKLDMSYDFYIKHNMHAVEWKLKTMINKNKALINKFNRHWRHPMNRNYSCYRDQKMKHLYEPIFNKYCVKKQKSQTR